jgi:arginyl-tRNA synthetase
MTAVPPQHLFAKMLERVHAACAAVLGPNADLARVVVEPPRDASHGDMATNAAMVLAKDAGQKPRELADKIAEALRADDLITKVDVAGPGFINLILEPHVWGEELRVVLAAGKDYGKSDIGKREEINVEFVSANPTGPMHVGHGRGAVFGDALANLLSFVGFDVTREYYINDAGAQVDVLARSAFLRYREALGENIGQIPDGLYPGDYLKPVGEQLARSHGNSLQDKNESEWLPIVRQTAVEWMLVQIMDDLRALNIEFDSFFSEKALNEQIWIFSEDNEPPILYFTPGTYNLMEGGPGGIRFYFAQRRIAEARRQGALAMSGVFSSRPAPGELGEPDYLGATLNNIRSKALVYEGRLPPPKGGNLEDWEDREQTLFRSTKFGDDVDRPLKKSDGSYTYFASDIAYHKSKFDRGFRNMIDVWGADHGGYIKRMMAAVKAISGGKAQLDVKLVQLVRLLRAGEPVKMSKRSGDFVTLREVVDEVGKDAVRFDMLYRKNDAVLDFDLAKVIEATRENPVFYVQYGHARGESVFRNARAEMPELPAASKERAEFLKDAPLDRLSDSGELSILRRLALYPRMVEAAALAHEPHRVAFYLYELASEFHAHWTRGKDLPHLRFIIQNDPDTTKARLALVQGIVTVLASGLALLGVEAPEEMR